MPLYMDIHIAQGIRLSDAVKAHYYDVQLEDQHNCNCKTFWVDEVRGTAFCLIEAPNKQCVKDLHNSSHGLVPNEIIEVNSNMVNLFLGKLHDPEGLFELSEEEIQSVYKDPAFRTIMITNIEDLRLLNHSMGKERTQSLLKLHNEIVKDQIRNFDGSEIELASGNRFIASFKLVSKAVSCAMVIQKQLHVAAEMLQFRIGLHAGMPVSEGNGELFGKTIQYAKHLCMLGKGNRIIISNIVNELLNNDADKFQTDADLQVITPSTELFLGELVEVLIKHWKDPEFDVEKFCRELSMSKSQLYRKTTKHVGLSPNELLREYRLQKSLELLKQPNLNISQTTFSSGFNSPSYFTRCFQKRFGLQPMEYIKAAV